MSVDLYASLYAMMAAASGAAPADQHASGGAAAPAEATAMLLATDPFAQEIPLTSDELQDQRGGFAVGGFLLNFGIRVGELTVSTALDGVNMASDQTTHSFSFGSEATTRIINNTQDGVRITSRHHLDIHISNFNQAVDLAGFSQSVSAMRVESHVLSTQNF